MTLKARAKVSGVDTGFQFDFQLIPTTGGNWQWLIRKSVDDGSTFSEVGRFTNATPTHFLICITTSVSLTSCGALSSISGTYATDAASD